MAGFNNDDPDAAKKMREMFSPAQVDQSVRQAIQFCWMMLPENAKTVSEAGGTGRDGATGRRTRRPVLLR